MILNPTSPQGNTNSVQYNAGNFFGGVTNNATATQKVLSQTSSGVPFWDIIPTAGQLTYYLQNAASDVAGEKQQIVTPQVAETNLSTAGLAGGTTELGDWITNAGVPNLTFIPAGSFEFHIHVAQTAGTKNTVLYAEIWEASATGVDIGKIGTTEVSSALGTKSESRLFFSIANVYPIAATSRVKTKVFTTVSGGGSAPTVVLYYGSTSDSHTSLPSNTVDATNFVPYTGATTNIDLNSKNFVTTGTIGGGAITGTSLIKSGGTSAQFLKADGSVDSSTYLTSLSGALLATGATVGATSQIQDFTNGVKGGIYDEFSINSIGTFSNQNTNTRTLTGIPANSSTGGTLSVAWPYKTSQVRITMSKSGGSVYTAGAVTNGSTTITWDDIGAANVNSATITIDWNSKISGGGGTFIATDTTYSVKDWTFIPRYDTGGSGNGGFMIQSPSTPSQTLTFSTASYGTFITASGNLYIGTGGAGAFVSGAGLSYTDGTLCKYGTNLYGEIVYNKTNEALMILMNTGTQYKVIFGGGVTYTKDMTASMGGTQTYPTLFFHDGTNTTTAWSKMYHGGGALNISSNEGAIIFGAASTDTTTMTSRFIPRTTASDPQNVTPASRPAGTVNEIACYANKLYLCTNAATPTWEKITSL